MSIYYKSLLACGGVPPNLPTKYYFSRHIYNSVSWKLFQIWSYFKLQLVRQKSLHAQEEKNLTYSSAQLYWFASKDAQRSLNVFTEYIL